MTRLSSARLAALLVLALCATSVRADDAGTWVWHCHILNHVEREDGMFGMVTAIVVTENPDFDPDDVPVRPHNWRKTAGTDGPIDPEAASTDG